MENNEWKRIEKELDELINCLLTSNERMERALSWYADDGNYLGDNGELSTAYKNKMPNKAREALGHPSEPDYPKLTPEQIQERKGAIEWIRNPAGGMRWVRASEFKTDKPVYRPYRRKREEPDEETEYDYGEIYVTEDSGEIFLDIDNEGSYEPQKFEKWKDFEILDEGKEVENV